MINPLRTIFENNKRIALLKEQIKEIEESSQRCLDYAMLKKIINQDNFVLNTSVSTRREPISDRVVSFIGSDKALEIAKFNIKDLEKVIGKDEIDALCKVKESITRVVEMVE